MVILGILCVGVVYEINNFFVYSISNVDIFKEYCNYFSVLLVKCDEFVCSEMDKVVFC